MDYASAILIGRRPKAALRNSGLVAFPLSQLRTGQEIYLSIKLT